MAKTKEVQETAVAIPEYRAPEFPYKKEYLQQITEKARKIVVEDLLDEVQMAPVKEIKKELAGFRIEITKYGKALRDNSNRFNKEVLSQEHDLLETIAPEEDRLRALVDLADKLALRKVRELLLPIRLQQLAAIGDGVECTEDSLYDMDDKQFASYKLERTQAHLESETRKMQEERDRVAREKELLEAQERARIEERDRADRNALLERERIERERVAERERAEREKAETEARHARELQAEKDRQKQESVAKLAKEKAEKERAEMDAKYILFRENLGYTEKTKTSFKEIVDGDTIVLWKKIGAFKMK